MEATSTTKEELPTDVDEFQQQSRRTWTIDPHTNLTRGWQLLGDIDRAADMLDSTMDEHKRALFYGDDNADVIRATGDGDYMLEQVEDEGWALLHASLGAATEAGEILEQARAVLSSDGEPDLENVAEEVGDLMYYLARLADVCDTSLLEIMQANNRKLRERFSDSFVEENALDRDTDAEKTAIDDPIDDLARKGLEQGWRVSSVEWSGDDEIWDAVLENNKQWKSGEFIDAFYDLSRPDRVFVIKAMIEEQATIEQQKTSAQHERPCPTR